MSSASREETDQLDLRFDSAGLVTAMVVEHETRAPLMLAHMNADALQRTLETGEAHFYSRSRKALWHKGATSGNALTVHTILIDCDQDALWLEVSIAGHGAACHTGRKTCFYRRVVHENGAIRLEMTGPAPLFDPEAVYGESE